jgi:ABC-2 type transport system permease protein
MRTIVFLLRKEFLQIFRHRIMLVLIFLMPLIQLIILANAADYEVDNIRLYIVDRDGSQASQRLTGLFESSEHFEILGYGQNPEAAYNSILGNETDLFLDIPRGFEEKLSVGGPAAMQVSVDAINGVKAGVSNAYVQAILQGFAMEYAKELAVAAPTSGQPGRLQIEYSNWFNPELSYDNFMVPGILVLLVTLVGMFLSSMNIVKEKEIGTIEQINVTPIRKYQFIIGKLAPFWIIGLMELSFGLIVGKVVFQIPFMGPLWVVYLFAGVYLIVVLGMGLFISTVTDTQQQAMFLAWFFLIIFILMSGLFTPIESMPEWAQRITDFNPVAYFVDVMRLVLLKGSGFSGIQPHLSIMIIYAVVINALAVLNYRKASA